jgi:capsular exopolysaccharide synthesis family protein
MAQKVMATDRVQREHELKLRRTALAAKSELVRSLDRRYQAKRRELGEQGGARLEFEFAQQALQRALGLLTSISDRATQMQAEMVAPGRPAVYRTATPPVEPEVKYPLIGLAASTLASLALPFAIAFVWETSVRRISTAEQLEQKTDVGVIGEISRLPMKKGRATSRVLGMELGLFEESIDSLRTGLLLSNDEHEIQVLAVCSAVSGEGKTSVSSQLAVSIARATGQPVLLIDGDMRAPDVHHIFDIPLSPGLADVLDHEVSLEEAINRSWSEHVHLLPAGELAKSPHKLLGNSAMRTTLDEARLWYRFIVIDTPPVLAASESLVVAKQADATLLCAMRDFSRENHVRLAHGKLVATGADMIGTVLNGVPVRSYASRYGSYGRYGYAGTSS